MKIPDIQQMICDEYGITLKQMLSRSRMSVWAHPRMVAMALARKDGHKLTVIGKAFKRDHSTVVHAVKVTTEAELGKFMVVK